MPGLDPGIRRKLNNTFLMDCRLEPGIDVGTYTAAVVTPPSTTMVCPVMKLDASEPR
jgi:hypothetical protein